MGVEVTATAGFQSRFRSRNSIVLETCNRRALMTMSVCVCVCVEGYCLMFAVKIFKLKVQYAANMQWKSINQACGSNKSKSKTK